MSQYLGTLRYLLVAGSDGSSTVHPAGSHVYPFAFQLQDTVPSSFEGSRGYVRYFCKATIDRPWKFDSSNLRAFTVIHHFDLNRFPNVVVIDYTVDSRYLEIEGTLKNSSRYQYFDISDL